MITNDYFTYEMVRDNLCLILSIGYRFQYASEAIELKLSKSQYFNEVFNNNESYLYSVSDVDLVKSIYPEIKNFDFNISYKEIEWASEIYMYLMDKTNLTIETIFIYLPIKKVYKMFEIYHEMDFSKVLEFFLEEREKSSIISKKMSSLKYTNLYVSKACDLSIPSITCLKNRKSNINKLNAKSCLLLAKTLKISMESLLEN